MKRIKEHIKKGDKWKGQRMKITYKEMMSI